MQAKEYRIDKFAIAGGVASNQTLREAMEKIVKSAEYSFTIRPLYFVRIMPQ